MTSAAPPSSGNLPAEPNSFIGRERDLTELALLLSDVRALTLCGPGGIGKTRLALRLACDLVPDFPDGAWLVELADTADPDLIPRRVAATLGIREEADQPMLGTLATALRGRRMLLILDNCEHIVDGARNSCTSCCGQLPAAADDRHQPRAAAGARGNRVERPAAVAARPRGPAVPGRSAPARGHAAVRRAGLGRAAPASSWAATTRRRWPRLCRTLDGMPLAIELAAARVRALSVEQIASRLDDRFRLLTSGDRTAPAPPADPAGRGGLEL